VSIINGKQRLIKPLSHNGNSSVIYYLMIEELFDVIHFVHGEQNLMCSELKTKYGIITIETIRYPRYIYLYVPTVKKDVLIEKVV